MLSVAGNVLDTTYVILFDGRLSQIYIIHLTYFSFRLNRFNFLITVTDPYQVKNIYHSPGKGGIFVLYFHFWS